MQNDFPSGIAAVTAHRPWPLPQSAWLMTQSWHHLLFAHWPVEAELLRAKLPAGLTLDLYDRQAWLGVVPFRMTNVAPRFVPALPFVSEFAELNVRTYVTVGGKPGVYFFSLDAESAMAVTAARSLLHLPYFTADMSVRRDGARVDYASRRTDSSAAPAAVRCAVSAGRSAVRSRTGSLDYFLTERYCLYNVDARFRAYRSGHSPRAMEVAACRGGYCDQHDGGRSGLTTAVDRANPAIFALGRTRSPGPGNSRVAGVVL
jgi:uncharacterized protein YqjF (DUF2071 family)